MEGGLNRKSVEVPHEVVLESAVCSVERGTEFPSTVSVRVFMGQILLWDSSTATEKQ